jgi:hypothetical protein
VIHALVPHAALALLVLLCCSRPALIYDSCVDDLNSVSLLYIEICAAQTHFWLFQVGSGFFARRDVLEYRWNGLCLPEVSFITPPRSLLLRNCFRQPLRGLETNYSSPRPPRKLFPSRRSFFCAAARLANLSTLN